MSWWRNKKRKPEKLEEPVDLLGNIFFYPKSADAIKRT